MEKNSKTTVEDAPLLIGVSGKKKSGKDTAGIELSLNHNMFKHAFADALKELCCNAFTMSEYDLFDVEFKEFNFFNFTVNQENLLKLFEEIDKLGVVTLSISQKQIIEQLLLNKTFVSAREMMQFIGTEVIRNVISETFFIDVLHERIKNKQRVVITDARFPNERNYVRSRGGKLLLVTRNSEKVDNHITENTFDDKYDGIIENNNSIGEYKKEIEQFYLCLVQNKKYRQSSKGKSWIQHFLNFFRTTKK